MRVEGQQTRDGRVLNHRFDICSMDESYRRRMNDQPVPFENEICKWRDCGMISR